MRAPRLIHFLLSFIFPFLNTLINIITQKHSQTFLSPHLQKYCLSRTPPLPHFQLLSSVLFLVMDPDFHAAVRAMTLVNGFDLIKWMREQLGVESFSPPLADEQAGLFHTDPLLRALRQDDLLRDEKGWYLLDPFVRRLLLDALSHSVKALLAAAYPKDYSLSGGGHLPGFIMACRFLQLGLPLHGSRSWVHRFDLDTSLIHLLAAASSRRRGARVLPHHRVRMGPRRLL